MFDMGFIADLRFILRQLPKPERRQSFLFSATLSFRVMELTWEFMNNPVQITITPNQKTVEKAEQVLYHVGREEKFNLLLGLLKREGGSRILIFSNTREEARRLEDRLGRNGWQARALTGDVDQKKRLQILNDFKDGELPVLVATDVASRGLHIEGVTHVINWDLPQDAEDYVHRIGRTARAGAAGKAISLADETSALAVEPIEKFIGQKILVEWVERRPLSGRDQADERGAAPLRRREAPADGQAAAGLGAAAASPGTAAAAESGRPGPSAASVRVPAGGIDRTFDLPLPEPERRRAALLAGHSDDLLYVPGPGFTSLIEPGIYSVDLRRRSLPMARRPCLFPRGARLRWRALPLALRAPRELSARESRLVLRALASRHRLHDVGRSPHRTRPAAGSTRLELRGRLAGRPARPTCAGPAAPRARERRRGRRLLLDGRPRPRPDGRDRRREPAPGASPATQSTPRSISPPGLYRALFDPAALPGARRLARRAPRLRRSQRDLPSSTSRSTPPGGGALSAR